MAAIPTVKIVSPKGPNGYLIVNEEDFDPATMRKWGEEVPIVAEAPKKPMGAQPIAAPARGRRPAKGKSPAARKVSAPPRNIYVGDVSGGAAPSNQSGAGEIIED